MPEERNVIPGAAPAEPAAMPSELQGKTPEQIYAMMSGEHQKIVTQMKTNFADKITSQEAEPEAPTTPALPPKSNLATDDSHAPTPPYGPYTPGMQVLGQPPPAETPDVITDPEGFMEQQFGRRIAPLVAATVQAQRATNVEVFKQSLPEDEWNKYGEEIEQFVGGLGGQAQMNIKSYQVGYNYVKSSHLDEIQEEMAKSTVSTAVATTAKALEEAGVDRDTIAAVVVKMGGAPAAPAAGAAGIEVPRSNLFQSQVGVLPATEVSTPAGAVNANRRAGPKLSPEEKMLAEEFGMSPQEWEAGKAQNTDIISQVRLAGGSA